MGAFFRIAAMAAALALAGCAGGNLGGTGGAGGSAGAAPKSWIVSDFVVASDVVAVDRGYTARLERKVGSFPPHERRQRTAERVNDEVVATIVALMREAGLDAQPGSEEALTLDQSVGVVSGRLHPADNAKPNTVGFGEGRGHVRTTMSVSLFSAGGKRELLTFTIEPAGLSRSTTNPKVAAARDKAINSIAASMGAKEKLSSDVEANARRVGRVAGERIVAFAQEQGWIAATAKPEVEAQPARPQRQPARAQPRRQQQQEPDEPASTNEPQQKPQSPWPNT